MKEPAYVAATLQWCNERRKEKGKKPLTKLPGGVRGDPLSCPCGKATGLSVGAVLWGEPGYLKPQSNSLPETVSEFVVAFDNGELPQYDARRN